MNAIIGLSHLALKTAAGAAAARLPRQGASRGPAPAGRDQRHPGLLQGRGGQARPGAQRLRAGKAAGQHRQPDQRKEPGQGAGAGVRSRAGRAAQPGGRLAAPGPDPAELRQQRGEVHRKGRDRRSRCARASAPSKDVLLHFRVQDTGIGLTPEQRGGCSRVSRRPTPRPRASSAARAGPGDLQAAGRAHGRRGGGGKRVRQGQHFWFSARLGIGAANARELVPRPTCAGGVRWWWTTTTTRAP